MFDGHSTLFDSFVVDWVTGRDSVWLEQLNARLEKTRATITGKGGVYDFTLERLRRDGIAPAEAADKLQNLSERYSSEFSLVTHNGLSADVPFTDRLSRSHDRQPISYGRDYIDTVAIERGVQVKPKKLAANWDTFCRDSRQLGGSKVKCNLREHCTQKYNLPVKDDHEADRDAVKTAFLIKTFRKASQNA